MRRPWVFPVALLSLLVGACGDGDGSTVGAGAPGDPAVSTTSPILTTTTPTTLRPAITTTTTALGNPGTGFGTETVSTTSSQRGLLKAVRVATVGGVDQVTFEFEGPLPPSRVGYVSRPIVQDGSGDEITVRGAAVLNVHFEPASGYDLAGEGRMAYTGPNRLTVATTTVVDVVRASDFEAVLEWALGVQTKAPFRVRTETSPNRIIVEVQRPSG